MRRDQRLHGLSSDHHHALRLASAIRRALAEQEALPELAARARARYDDELEPHFRVEEELLLPALEAAEAPALAHRTREEHRELVALLEAAEGGDREALSRFGRRLDAHVRFEERELFPACEAHLDASVLDAVAQRAPKPT